MKTFQANIAKKLALYYSFKQRKSNIIERKTISKTCNQQIIHIYGLYTCTNYDFTDMSISQFCIASFLQRLMESIRYINKWVAWFSPVLRF